MTSQAHQLAQGTTAVTLVWPAWSATLERHEAGLLEVFGVSAYCQLLGQSGDLLGIVSLGFGGALGALPGVED